MTFHVNRLLKIRLNISCEAIHMKYQALFSRSFRMSSATFVTGDLRSLFERSPSLLKRLSGFSLF